MRNLIKMKYLPGLLMLAMLSAAPLAADTFQVTRTQEKPYQPAVFHMEDHRVTFRNQPGCESCHHEGDTDRTCAVSGCHQGYEGTRMFHTTCISCHRVQAQNAPVTCRGCHRGPAPGKETQ